SASFLPPSAPSNRNQHHGQEAGMSKLIVEAITEYYGERCPDYDEDCFCCKVWIEYDALTSPARCDELKTEKWEAFIVGDWLQISGEHAAWKHSKVRELVTRQNAEEVIAAKDARIAELE